MTENEANMRGKYLDARVAVRNSAIEKSRPDDVDRANTLDTFLDEMLAEYAEKTGFSIEELFLAMAARRNYWAVNFYQRANFPALEKVHFFDTMDELNAAINANEGFRCPKCDGVSSKPYHCTVGTCDWKAGGLFRTLGKGTHIATRDTFLTHGKVDEIFMPVCMEVAA